MQNDGPITEWQNNGLLEQWLYSIYSIVLGLYKWFDHMQCGVGPLLYEQVHCQHSSHGNDRQLGMTDIGEWQWQTVVNDMHNGGCHTMANDRQWWMIDNGNYRQWSMTGNGIWQTWEWQTMWNCRQWEMTDNG